MLSKKAFRPKEIRKTRSPCRKSSPCLILLAALTFLCSVMLIHAAARRQADASHIAYLAKTVSYYSLTDLCLFGEARYTRHLSQADLHSAFQDHPAALEHFPTGSIAGPPAGLRRFNERLDRKTSQHP